MSGELVLLTGATGHLGFRTLVFALQAGYRVRVALRNPQQSHKIKSGKSVQPHLSQVEFATVPDITADQAYASAIVGVDHVLHIASPIPSPEDTSNDWQKTFFDPAMKGTLSMLTAAAKTNSVKTVVITSSVVVLKAAEGKDRAGPGDVLPAPDLEAAVKLQNPFMAYGVSKILAHNIASDFVKKENCKFSLVRVLPGYIQGPNELLERDEDFFSGSNEGTINAILGNVVPRSKPTSQVWLDDAAKAHVLSLDSSKAKNGDVFVIVGNGGNSVSWDEVANVAAKRFPKAFENGTLKKMVGQECNPPKYDVKSSESALGFSFAGTEQMIEGLVEQYLRFHGHAVEAS